MDVFETSPCVGIATHSTFQINGRGWFQRGRNFVAPPAQHGANKIEVEPEGQFGADGWEASQAPGDLRPPPLTRGHMGECGGQCREQVFRLLAFAPNALEGLLSVVTPSSPGIRTSAFADLVYS